LSNSWLAMLSAALSFILLSLAGSVAISEAKCGSMNAEEMSSISSKDDIEGAIIRMIQYYRMEDGGVDWAGLSDCFTSFGNRFTVELVPGGGPHNSDVFRFSFDNSGTLSYLFGAPGASNGVFTAIFIQAPSGEVAVVRRGGREEWLRLE
jgi:hypothetical protein